jgi:hypothetical protein
MRTLLNTSIIRTLAAALLTVLVGLSAGCSVSESVKGSSDSASDSAGSSSDSLGSISRSSSPESTESSYQNDVRDYTAAYLRTDGQIDSFRRGIGDLARKHGITNWEESTATYAGIGEGLGVARAKPNQLQTYMDGLAGQDPVKRAVMQKGYDSRK